MRIEKLQELPEIRFSQTKNVWTQSGWIRSFVTRSDGCSIGRLSFHHGELYSVKWYKDGMNFVPFDDSDWVQAQFEFWRKTGGRLSRTLYDRLVADCVRDCKEELERNQELRRQNPKKGRRKLTGKDPRRLFHRRILYES